MLNIEKVFENEKTRAISYKFFGIPLGFLTVIILINYTNAYYFALYTKAMLIISLLNVFFINSTRKIIYKNDLKNEKTFSLSLGKILSLLVIPLIISSIITFIIIEMKEEDLFYFLTLTLAGLVFCIQGLYFQINNMTEKYFFNENILRPIIFLLLISFSDNSLLIGLISFSILIMYEFKKNINIKRGIKLQNYYKKESFAMMSTIVLNSIPSLLIIYETNSQNVIEMRITTMLCSVLLVSQSVLHTINFKSFAHQSDKKEENESKRKRFRTDVFKISIPLFLMMLIFWIYEFDELLFQVSLNYYLLICMCSIMIQISFGPVMLLLLNKNSNIIRNVNVIVSLLVGIVYFYTRDFYIIYCIVNVLPFFIFSLIWKRGV